MKRDITIAIASGLTASAKIKGEILMTNFSRYAYWITMQLFTLGTLTMFFLAGVSVFANPIRWAIHGDLGRTLTLLPLLLVILSLTGRLPRKLIWMTVLLLGLYIVQGVLIAFRGSVPMVSALHPVNGSLLVGLSIGLAKGARHLIRKPEAVPAASEIGSLAAAD